MVVYPVVIREALIHLAIGQNGWAYDVMRKSLHLITARNSTLKAVVL